jgi:hypothetical protein
MRSIRLMSLVTLALLAGAACGQAEGRLPRKVRSLFVPRAELQSEDSQARKMEMILSWPVEGWGTTREDAWQRALENARAELPAHLAARDLELDWRPSAKYIKDNLIKGKPEDLKRQDFDEPVGQAQGVRFQIGITAKDWQQLLQQDRQVRADSRMLLLARMLAGVVAFLVAVAGYLRLEEMTKGYYTAWLRLVAIGFVTAVGAGIWWIS